MYDEHSYRKPPRQPATTQANWGETVAGKFAMGRLGREEKLYSGRNENGMYEAGGRTVFGMEVKYLNSKGYTFENGYAIKKQ